MRREGRAHDRLVEGAEEEGQQDRPEDLEAGAAARARSPGCAAPCGAPPDGAVGGAPPGAAVSAVGLPSITGRPSRSREAARVRVRASSASSRIRRTPAATARSWSVGQRPEELLDQVEAPAVVLGDRGPALVGHAGEHDPAVLGVAQRSTRPRCSIRSRSPVAFGSADAEPVCKTAHRQGAVFLQNPEDLEVAQADPAVMDAAGDGAPSTARQHGDALRDLAEGLSQSSRQRRRRRPRESLTVT